MQREEEQSQRKIFPSISYIPFLTRLVSLLLKHLLFSLVLENI